MADYVTTKQAAESYGETERSIRNRIRAGEIKAHQHFGASGGGVSGKIGFIPHEATAIRLSDSQREMDYSQSMKDLREAVNSHYCVPPEVMGLVENSNRATAQQAKIIYAENVLTPRLKARQDAVNMQLVSCFGEGLFYEYDDIIPQDAEFQLQIANEGVSRSTLLVNEWRTANGFGEVPWGNVVASSLSVMLMPPDELTPSERVKDTSTTDLSYEA